MTTKTRANWRTPDATKSKVDENADRMAWLKERRAGIGGTDAAALLGVHISLTMSTARDVTPADVFFDKIDTAEPVEDDKDIFALGHLMEPELARRAEAAFGVTTKPGGFYRHKVDTYRYANPDFLTSDGGILEGKTASNRRNREGVSTGDKWLAGDVSDHAYVQTQHYLAVTGRSHSYYSVGIRDDHSGWDRVPRSAWGEAWFPDLAIKEWVQVGPIPRDEAVIARIVEAAAEMWGHVQAGTLPPGFTDARPVAERFAAGIKDRDIEADVPAMTRDDLARLAAVKIEQGRLADERAAIEGRLKSGIGSGEYLTLGGERAVRWSSYLQDDFDKAAFAKAHPDLVAAFTRQKPRRRLTILGGGA